MYESEYMYFLVCQTLTLLSLCCIIYIGRSIISGLSKLVKGATKDLVKAVERIEKVTEQNKENKEM